MADIRLSGLMKTYGETTALAATDLRIRDGEFFTLLGPSGSGKTTLLRMVGGFIAPTAGHVAIGGRDVTDLPPHRRNLGVVFQSYALFPHLSVLDNVAFGLRMRGVAAADRASRAAQALALVGLEGFASRAPQQLSGGQQQRVALARALAIDPDVLLLDEPLGALDLNLRKQLQRELRDLHRRLGRTFIYVTHDQDEALMLSDRIAIVSDGRIHQVGAPRDLYDRPESAFVAGFLGDSTFLPGRAQAGGFRLNDGTLVPVTAGAGGVAQALTIRPERLRLLAPEEGAEVILSATLQTVRFAGARVFVSGRLSDGTDLELAVPNDGAAADRIGAEGSALRIGFAARDARLLAAQDAGPDTGPEAVAS